MEVLDKDTFKVKVFDYEVNRTWKFVGTRPAIVDFYADWCGPCKALSPILDEISKEYGGLIDVYKIDTEASPELAAMFGVRSIPSLLFIPKEGEPAMAAGLAPKNDLKRAIKEILSVDEPRK